MEKFLADESVDFHIINYLRNSGYEVKTIIETNPSTVELLSQFFGNF